MSELPFWSFVCEADQFLARRVTGGRERPQTLWVDKLPEGHSKYLWVTKMNENLVVIYLYVVFMVGWSLCMFFGYRNLKRAGESPELLMWLSLIIWPLAFVTYIHSVKLVRESARIRAQREAELARERAQRIAELAGLEVQRKEEDRRKEAEARQRAAEQRAQSQRALTIRLSGLVSKSAETAATLPPLVRAAEKSLDLAEEEFQDGAFAPFWDAVEEATNKLAYFDTTVQQLINNSEHYNREASELETPAPPFQIGLNTLPDATQTVSRMRGIVRRAQKDIGFAMIYEQRRTNLLLVSGFVNLGQAIGELGDRLDSSLDHLSSAIGISISELGSDISASHMSMTSNLTAELERSRKQAASDAETRREHERKELELLDNIQRRS